MKLELEVQQYVMRKLNVLSAGSFSNLIGQKALIHFLRILKNYKREEKESSLFTFLNIGEMWWGWTLIISRESLGHIVRFFPRNQF